MNFSKFKVNTLGQYQLWTQWHNLPSNLNQYLPVEGWGQTKGKSIPLLDRIYRLCSTESIPTIFLASFP